MNSFNNKLILQHKQKLFLSNRLTQNIKILSMSYAELIDLIKKEAEENPMLDLDTSKMEYREEYSLRSYRGKTKSNNEDDIDLYVSQIEDRYSSIDLIKREISYLNLSDIELEIAKRIADNLDESGFISRTELEDMAVDMAWNFSDVKKTMRELRTLNPAGIFAYNLKDSLLLQLRRLEERNLIAESILLHSQNLLLRGDITSIAAKLKVSNEKVEKAINLFKTLNPKPLSLVNADMEYNYVIPDIKILFDEDGKLIIITDEYISTAIKIDRNYEYMLKNKSQDAATKNYIKQEYAKLKLIKSSIEKRNETIKLITGFIFNLQKDYFIKNNGRLKKLTMKMIAEALNIHESTVSRTLRDKYVDTPMGIFELKFFLQKGFKKNEDNMTFSVSELKSLIKNLIETEDKSKPLTDIRINEILKAKGYNISRRCVCKYREELGYTSSNKRKIKRGTV